MYVRVIGAGLAGCEAAMQLSRRGIKVELYEMKPKKFSPAHSYAGFGELVCSNSLKAMRVGSAAGLLKEEMRYFSSIMMEAAESSFVEAGGSLAVDRGIFSDYITKKLETEDNIEIKREEFLKLEDDGVITVIATGPLTSEGFSDEIQKIIGDNKLYFFDAASPIIKTESIDMEKAFFGSRYDRGDADYINCPMDKEEYERFYKALVEAKTVELKEFEKSSLKVYEGCMPIEVMAKRGQDTIRYGPLKPVGITNPKKEGRPYAVVQLRKENKEGTLYNIVGFQTNLKFKDQKEVFQKIPGLEKADFARYGVMHRNTFINSPALVDEFFSLRTNPNIYFAGQITGVEGYIESGSCGIYVGYNIARRILGKDMVEFPKETMMGSLFRYATRSVSKDFQPMGCNMGILPELDEKFRDKKLKYEKYAERALKSLKTIEV